MEETLVALIPFNDDRLKPKRTWFWVLVGIANYVNISNSNYYIVQVVNTSATIISKFQPWSSEVIGSGLNASTISVAPLSHGNNQLMFNNSVTLTDVVAEYCQAPFSRLTSLYVNMQFDIVVALVYFNHRMSAVLTNRQTHAHFHEHLMKMSMLNLDGIARFKILY
ncbi:hypothetical protein NECAME_13814 [Necator americanus]|uniref:Transmembrane protein 106 C-terminal domain-containing protein n=1 Tax=Necator americanus TaxID=51031 RepID=W2SUS0_NECAM|nr:hypothetical protein NECAME_13814 [Necator americanus]ETN72586.1 hypothetical protein NECAME_13814 [Necator americanus]